jgi:poly(A)-specific ribonuclease
MLCAGGFFLLYRYNFHLFPRDELQLGMPAYSFSCQSSYLSTMSNDGFDFNMCIYDGKWYVMLLYR